MKGDESQSQSRVALLGWELAVPSDMRQELSSTEVRGEVCLALDPRATTVISVSLASGTAAHSPSAYFASILETFAPVDSQVGPIEHVPSGIVFEGITLRRPTKAPENLHVEVYAVKWQGRLVAAKLLWMEGNPRADEHRIAVLDMVAAMLVATPIPV